MNQFPDWHISWGWNYPDNFAVMTVVFVPSQQVAWFGYNNPSDELPIQNYPDVGPNAVSST